jgi:gamma-glutamyl:cysteine ligase YbdK (ATP-grasp superfamily)
MMPTVLHLFEGFGVELEYMIVDAGSLSVKPVADEVLKAAAGRIVSDLDRPGGVTWSNELALHVLELKSTRPLAQLEGAAAEFQRQVGEVQELLRPMNAVLMPGAMHPWMDPFREMKIWPHEYSAVYEAFNRVFDCRGHGWANLQSVHLNLPFADDEEFGRLHAAVRILLPILPALAASSPALGGTVSGILDNRLDVYRSNSARIPSVAGSIIPEAVFTRKDYEEQIFGPMYADIAPHDPEGVLRDEFLNARGAIARFGRGSVEIRVLDVQECPAADLAICAAVVAVLRLLAQERLSSSSAQRACPTQGLHELFLACVRDGEQAQIGDREYLKLLGEDHASKMSAGELWQRLTARAGAGIQEEFRVPLNVILGEGPLSRRLLRKLGKSPSFEQLKRVYEALCHCLRNGRMFTSSTLP